MALTIPENYPGVHQPPATIAGCGEFCDGSDRGGFGALSAGVGVEFGVNDQNIYVFVHSENVIQAAVADVVSPAVAAEDPDGFLDEAIFCVQNFFLQASVCATFDVAFFEECNEVCRGFLAAFGVVHVFEPSFASAFKFRVSRASVFQGSNEIFKSVSSLSVSEVHAVAEFGVVFE